MSEIEEQLKMRKNTLGRGLSSLFTDLNEAPVSLPLEKVLAGKNQPRKFFAEEELNSLASSIEEKGVLQPILVRVHPEISDRYEIIAGERRWRASKIAGLSHIPVLVREFTDAEVLEVGLLENIQRQNLNPIEEAKGYQRLAEEFDYTQDTLSRALGKSRSYITNTMRLLTLPEKVQEDLVNGKLTAGHGRTLIGLKNSENLAKEIIEKGLSVREAEALSKGIKTPEQSPTSSKSVSSKSSDPEQDILRQHLSKLFGTSVELIIKGTGGKIVIPFKDLIQLDGLIQEFNKLDIDENLFQVKQIKKKANTQSY